MTMMVICKVIMRKVQLKDAKVNLSAVVDQATRGKPSVITRHGKPPGGHSWLRRLEAAIAGAFFWSAPDVGAS